MNRKEVKIPGPDHPITVTPSPHRVVVTAGGSVLAETRHALTLQESTYPAAQYIPREDVDMSRLTRTEHRTYCPYKGECSYYSINTGADMRENAVWTYENPYDAVSAIREYLAFYPSRVDSIELLSSDKTS